MSVEAVHERAMAEDDEAVAVRFVGVEGAVVSAVVLPDQPARRAQRYQAAYALRFALSGCECAAEQSYQSTFSVWLACQAVAQLRSREPLPSLS